MATRRKVGFSNSASEASRRQLMQPVPCWEKMWVLPEGAPAGSLKVYKWVRTEKKQHFSEDENEELIDQPLAPLPDEPEVVEGDDDMEQDDTNTSVPPPTVPASREVSEPLQPKPESKPATPKPHPLSVSFQPDESPAPGGEGGFAEFLKPDVEDSAGDLAMDGDLTLDMSQMGPDGEPFETSNDLSQLQATDALLGGGPLLDQAMEEDPFNGEKPA